MIIIDAKDAIVGRFATVAAKKALLGEHVAIINCKDAVVTGKKKAIIAHWNEKMDRGAPRQGPFFPRLSDRFVRKMIRGMLPYKQPRGRDAYKRIMCYSGDPKIEGTAFPIESANVEKIPGMQYMRIGDLVKYLGGKHEE